MQGNLKDKLLRVERTINAYLKNEDEPTEEINIDIIPFDKLKEIVPPKQDDPLLYYGYELESKQIDLINSFLKNKIEPDFNRYNYILVCGGIYDWDKK
jgi:hypothetical protein